MSAEESWVAAEEVATHLQVTKDSIYRWIESKGFPAHRVGRLLRFKLSEVDDWVRSSSGMGNSDDHSRDALKPKTSTPERDGRDG